MSEPARVERDFAGEVEVRADHLWGAQTQRALNAFTISDLRMPQALVRTLGSLKRAAAQSNNGLGLLDDRLTAVIVRAAGEIAAGEHDDQFRIDLFQTGSGTNTNMNANEVIANRANQLLGQSLGAKTPVHPNDHVNLGQSSNDVTPTIIHATAQTALTHRLLPALRYLYATLADLARRTGDVVKSGRTHLQDAVPIRMGQEFAGHAGQIARGIRRIEATQAGLAEVALGGTAVGTGVNTHPDFAARVVAKLADEFDIDLRETGNHFQAQNCSDAVVFVSGALRTVAVSLLKITEDIRWMSSGPVAGLAEITVPTLGMGSSIMPGKTNPVIAEAVSQAAVKVIGNDATIVAAGSRANFEITVMSPVTAYALLESVDILIGAATTFADRCLAGVCPTGTGPRLVAHNAMLATALAPRIGYEKAAAIAKTAAARQKSVLDTARAMSDVPQDDLVTLLDATSMTGPVGVETDE
ncbi:class II fumarate hydratase [Mycobacterium sp. 21AC1]|uniref:class II fumarate hydratase n=1 Tax=[Mycobacterium] appelbergii TaxID=2939269 RepID=UPI0029391B8A|nr:class II fumarate hydratase [Mycobacterium sp. 21AC1]MDV3126146.1 class II fumarate hydratase [Mycobacterium sp. 21AC1]